MSAEFISEYLQRAREIIGDRSAAEEGYDDQVVAGLEQGLHIAEALRVANQKFPDEALEIDPASVADVQAHYEYLTEHSRILRRLNLK